jgi:hypothetical protein
MPFRYSTRQPVHFINNRRKECTLGSLLSFYIRDPIRYESLWNSSSIRTQNYQSSSFLRIKWNSSNKRLDPTKEVRKFSGDRYLVSNINITTERTEGELRLALTLTNIYLQLKKLKLQLWSFVDFSRRLNNILSHRRVWERYLTYDPQRVAV